MPTGLDGWRCDLSSPRGISRLSAGQQAGSGCFVVGCTGLLTTGCAVLPGEFGPADLAVNSNVDVDAASTVLHLVLNERACASGRAPTNRSIRKTVIEDEASIKVKVEVAGVSGGADCQSNPWHPVTVELDEPLGERVILDLETGEKLTPIAPGF